MADVFISWASPDRPVVDELEARLRAFGINYWISSRGMGVGEDPKDRVQKEIREAKVAVFVLSGQAVDREWIQREVDWCVFANKTILPVALTRLPDEAVPRLIASLHRADLSPGPKREQNLVQFVNEVQDALVTSPPLILPCALFAMNREQYNKLPKNDVRWDAIVRMCGIAGIHAKDVDDQLNARYGATDMDFSPFEANKPLRTTIYETLLMLNVERTAARRKQLHLLWCQDRLIGPEADDTLKDLWATGNPILIVDSVSLCHDDIRSTIAQLPQPDYISRLSLLWVPPYTRHTEALEGWIQSATQEVSLFNEGFRRFKQRTLLDRWTAFDIATPVALSDWIYRVGSYQPDNPVPMRLRATIMRQQLPSGFSDTAQFNQ